MTMNLATPLKKLNTEQTKLEVLAMLLNVQKSTVSKMGQKKLGDTELNRLKDFVEAVGGELKAEIKLPNGLVMKI